MSLEEETEIEIQDFLQLRDKKLIELNKIRQSVESEVQMWYMSDVFFSFFNVYKKENKFSTGKQNKG